MWINVVPGKDVNLTLACPEVTKGERRQQRRRLDEEKVEWEIWSRDKKNWEPLVEANHPFQKKGVDLYVGRATQAHSGEENCKGEIGPMRERDREWKMEIEDARADESPRNAKMLTTDHGRSRNFYEEG